MCLSPKNPELESMGDLQTAKVIEVKLFKTNLWTNFNLFKSNFTGDPKNASLLSSTVPAENAL